MTFHIRFGTTGGTMFSSAWAPLLLSVLALVLPSEGHAVCYGKCKTPSGNTCTVSVPNFACNGGGNSRCNGPTEPCKYDCGRTVARPSSCGPLSRCSVRN